MPISEAVAAYIRPDQSEKFYDDQLRSILSEQLLVLDLVGHHKVFCDATRPRRPRYRYDSARQQ